MKLVQFSLFLPVLILPAVALWRLSCLWDYRVITVYLFLISLAGYIACYRDKRKAQRGEWRTPEMALHLIELAGGWAASFGAQRQFRHKTSKVSYQVKFWLIVLIHQAVALDFILDWLLLTRIIQALTT